MSFPSSPVDGQIEVINNISYRWSDDLTAWVRVALTSVNTLTANQVNVIGTTDTTGTDTGALIVAGGVGVAKDLYVGGSIHAVGNITADGNINLGNQTGTDTLSIGAEITSDILPKFPNTYKIGSEEKAWLSVYANNLGLQETLKLTTGTYVAILGTIDFASDLPTTYPSPNQYEAYVALDDNTLRVWDGANWVLYSDIATTYQDINKQYARAPRTYTNKDVIYNGVTVDQFLVGDFYYDDGVNNPSGDGYPHLYLYYDTGLGYTNLLDLLPPTLR